MDKVINAYRAFVQKIKFRRYIFHSDMRQAWAKIEVKYCIKALNDEIAINNDIRV